MLHFPIEAMNTSLNLFLFPMKCSVCFGEFVVVDVNDAGCSLELTECVLA